VSKVAASALESLPVQWCLCHWARDSAVALKEVNMRGLSSCLLGWWCASLSTPALTTASSNAKAEASISLCSLQDKSLLKASGGPKLLGLCRGQHRNRHHPSPLHITTG